MQNETEKLNQFFKTNNTVIDHHQWRELCFAFKFDHWFVGLHTSPNSMPVDYRTHYLKYGRTLFVKSTKMTLFVQSNHIQKIVED